MEEMIAQFRRWNRERSIRAAESKEKQLEKLRKSLKQKLEKLQGADRKDDVVTFEQLGVDRLFVDESQAFKNRANRCA